MLMVSNAVRAAMLAATVAFGYLASGAAAAADAAGNPPAPEAGAPLQAGDPPELTRFDGKSYKIYPDGKVNFATFRGANMYGNVCGPCHGLNAQGSSFAPSLVESLKTLSYGDFVQIVTEGRTGTQGQGTSVMPTFGDSPSVAKNIPSIYAYLKARADGAIGSGDLAWEGPKTE